MTDAIEIEDPTLSPTRMPVYAPSSAPPDVDDPPIDAIEVQDPTLSPTRMPTYSPSTALGVPPIDAIEVQDPTLSPTRMPTYAPSEAPEVPIAGAEFTPSPTHFDPWPTSSEVVSEPVEVAPTQAPTHFDPWPTSSEVVSEPVEVAPTLAPYPKPTSKPYPAPTTTDEPPMAALEVPKDCYDDPSWYESKFRLTRLFVILTTRAVTMMEYDCDWVAMQPATRCNAEGSNGFYAFE